jgi:Cu-processing system permease protein
MKVLIAVALNTWREFVRDRIFYVVLFVALIILGFSYLLASLSIVESAKLLLDFGFAAASLTGVVMAIFLGTVSVAKEVDNRTIYTILSKPVSRSNYIIGKFLGCGFLLFVSHIVFGFSIYGIIFLAQNNVPPGFIACIFLIFLENLVVLGVSFLCSSLMGTLVAVGATFSLFLAGRSSVTLQMLMEKAESSEGRVLATVLYYALPNLERFNIRDVVAYGKPFPPEMISYGVCYAVFYLLATISISCILFQKRDLP